MKTAVMLAVVACLVGSASLARAGQTLASPTVFGATNQNSAQCTIRNVGNSSIPVSINIVDESGVPLLSTNSCGTPAVVTPGHACIVTAQISSGAAYACSATASGSVKKLRGILVLYHIDIGSGGTPPLIPRRSAELR